MERRFEAWVDAVGGLTFVSRGTGIPVTTLSGIKNDPLRGCNITTAHLLVEFSKDHPHPQTGESLGYEDFLPAETEAA